MTSANDTWGYDDWHETWDYGEWPEKPSKRSRSRSMGRARKRSLGTLTSQANTECEPWDNADITAVSPDSAGRMPWSDCDAPRGKALMKYYYRLQRIVDIREWDSFDDGIHRALPVTFRFSANADAAYRAEGEGLLEAWSREGLGTRRLGVVDGWQLHVDKHTLRSAAVGSDEARLREWMIRGTQSGKLVRQEVASMLPAVVLGVQPGHVVLDMCAAPGSKTSQLVEMLDGARRSLLASAPAPEQSASAVSGGVVVANDNDAVRAYTLVKRIADLGPSKASVVVTLHDAKKLPRPTGCGGGYDRIVCDVPCTGDGTTRKHPEVFLRWEPLLALRSHSLQLQIAMRGAALLKVGGLMSYSTCSLNPIENEAVVAALLQRCGNALELVDGTAALASSLCGGCAPGMSSWKVYDSQMRAHESLGALRSAGGIPAAERRKFVSTMWPPRPPSGHRAEERGGPAGTAGTAGTATAAVSVAAAGAPPKNRHERRLASGIASSWSPPPLERCVRLMANRSDCGGFFVALLRKVAPLPALPTPPWPRHTTSSSRRRSTSAESSAVATDSDGSGGNRGGGDGSGSGSSGGSSLPAGDAYREALSYAYRPVRSNTVEVCAAIATSAGVTPSAHVASRLLEGRLFQRGVRGSWLVYLSPECEQLTCGADAATVRTKRLNVVNAGATIFKRRRRRASKSSTAREGRSEWILTAVGRALLQKVQAASSRLGA